MFDNIQPGQTIKVTITSEPTNAAARKTLQRVLNKDDQLRARNRMQKKIRRRGMRPTTRSGRIWNVRVPKQHQVKGRAGESGTVRATVDVLRDLGSVERFISIEPSR